MNDIVDKINSDLKKINERLKVTFDTEDVYGQDFEEYGIEDIEETRHLALLLEDEDGDSATIVKEYFSFDVRRSLMFGQSDINYLESAGFTRQEIHEIEIILLSYSKQS